MKLKAKSVYTLAVILFLLLFVKVFGAFLSESLALSASVVHTMLDFGVVIVGFATFLVGERKRSKTPYFGYTYMELLVASVYSISLILIVIFLIKSAISVLLYNTELNVFDIELFHSHAEEHAHSLEHSHAEEHTKHEPLGSNINYSLTTLFAFMNIFIQLFIVIVANLFKNNYNKNITMSALSWHVMIDLVSTIIILAGAIWAYSTKYFWIDPVVAIIISALFLRNAFFILFSVIGNLKRKITKTTIYDISNAILNVSSHVKGVHHIHLDDSGISPHLTCHILIDDLTKTQEIIDKTNKVLNDRFKICHTNLQIEISCDNHYCSNC